MSHHLLQKVSVPEGTSGKWKVERFEVTAEQAALERIRGIMSGRSVREGSYTRLLRGGTLVMSDTDDEMRDHWTPVWAARDDILINGLGLGCVLAACLRKPEVRKVTVIEASEDVIQLVGPSYVDPRVEIIHADAFEYAPPKGVRFGMVWHDIWDYITADNLPEMTRLKRKYGRRTDWQGCWAESLCRRAARRYA